MPGDPCHTRRLSISPSGVQGPLVIWADFQLFDRPRRVKSLTILLILTTNILLGKFVCNCICRFVSLILILQALAQLTSKRIANLQDALRPGIRRCHFWYGPFSSHFSRAGSAFSPPLSDRAFADDGPVGVGKGIIASSTGLVRCLCA